MLFLTDFRFVSVVLVFNSDREGKKESERGVCMRERAYEVHIIRMCMR